MGWTLGGDAFTHLLLGSACVGLFAETGANPVVVPQNTAAKYLLKPPYTRASWPGETLRPLCRQFFHVDLTSLSDRAFLQNLELSARARSIVNRLLIVLDHLVVGGDLGDRGCCFLLSWFSSCGCVILRSAASWSVNIVFHSTKSRHMISCRRPELLSGCGNRYMLRVRVRPARQHTQDQTVLRISTLIS